MQGENLTFITTIIKKVRNYPDVVIEATVIEYVKEQTGKDFYYDNDLNIYKNKADSELLDFFSSIKFPVNVEFITEFFEALLDEENVIKNGIVFTPEYIADYIVNAGLQSISAHTCPKVVDPGCGCGIFLASAARILHEKYGKSFAYVLSNNIFGIELDKNNARRCKLVLNLLPLLYGESNKGVSANILCMDSLKCSWVEAFHVDSFDLVVGNPPYVNTHDMEVCTAKFLKETFLTTKTGVYNIFYAFIEYAMQFLDEEGMLSYIVPNNFLTIKSATDLRKFIIERKALHLIIDFANNMVFKPVRTYNCIIQLTKQENRTFHYAVMGPTDDIQKALNTLEFDTMPIEKLDVNGWKLVDKQTRTNIQKIEGQMYSIKKSIRTGIATLRDDIYMVEKNGSGYYKIVGGKKYSVDDELVKRLYKIPDLKKDVNIDTICRYIIFPYKKGVTGYEIIPEKQMKSTYYKTYNYLLSQKDILDKRDKGKPNPVAWYAYGRTQGLNKYGVKLLFPTFSNKPKFILVKDEDALFCNGYAIFQDGYLDIRIVRKILNSKVMAYYISNTSYAIEGGYYCYQKKYIEKFTIPLFSTEELKNIESFSESELDEFLIQKYGLNI